MVRFVLPSEVLDEKAAGLDVHIPVVSKSSELHYRAIKQDHIPPNIPALEHRQITRGGHFTSSASEGKELTCISDSSWE